MKDEDGRVLHICLRDPKGFANLKTKFILPVIGIMHGWVQRDGENAEPMDCLRFDTLQYRIGVAWWRWQFSVAFAEWRDDRTKEQIIYDSEQEDFIYAKNNS